MDTKVRELFSACEAFASRLWREVEELKLASDLSEIDHVCFRVETRESYESWKKLLTPWGRVLSEAMVNGRPITTYKLNQSLVTDAGLRIPLLELPAPKPGAFYAEGVEHIEAVTKIPLSAFVDRYADFPFNKKNMDDKLNPDVTLSLKAGLIKFHPASLEKVIELENI